MPMIDVIVPEDSSRPPDDDTILSSFFLLSVSLSVCEMY